MLELQLLGPVVLRRDGVALPLAIKKTQALLVLLARGGAMPRGRVAALLWPLLDESTGRRNLRRELARLREAGAPDAVHADGDFLALAETTDCDARRLETAVAQGQPDDALTAWHGPPADGLALDDAAAFDEWWALERERLHDLRRRALQASAVACEARGDLAAALQRIEALLADDPLQEHHHRDAMRLLAASGRREAALAQYERCHGLLRAELGLSPMAETEALAAALRAPSGAAPLAAAHAATTPAEPRDGPPPLLPERLPFVGREAEVTALERAWHAGRSMLVEGEGGVGKSRLAIDFAASHGPYALVRSRASDSAVPYAAFTRALRALAGPTPDLGALPGWAQDELARLLPELGPAPPPLRSAAERSRFVEACAQGWLALAADNFDAVVLDDWHHADAASGDLLAFIAQRRREQGLGSAREILLYRPDVAAQARDSLRRLRDSSDALHLHLLPLADAAVLQLVQQLSGVAHPARFSARLRQATRGNPFFLGETLRHLAERQLLTVGADGVWHTPFDDATQDYRELPVPQSVHDAVLSRVLRLPAAARRVLEAAALAAEPFAPRLLAPACALSELDAVLAIEQAVEAQLLREHEAGGYMFAHDLVQQALDASLSAERRRLVHRRLALGAEATGASPALIASHHEASGEPARAVAHRLAAGDAAQRLHAHAQAVMHWQQALADGPAPSQAMTLHLNLLRTTRLLGQREASPAHIAALHQLAASGALSADERADVLIAVAGSLARNEAAPEGLRVLEELPPTLNERQQAQVMSVRADALRELGRVDEALVAARAALAMPGLQGADRTQMLDSLVLAEHTAGRVQAALALVDQTVDLCTQLGDQLGIVRALYRRGTFLFELGEHARSEAELLRCVELCSRVGSLNVQRAALYSLCCLYSSQTRPAQVLAVARQGWDAQPPLPRSELRVMYRMAFVDAHLALGGLGAAWEHAAPAVAEALAVGEPLAAIATLTTSLELFVLLGEQATAAPLLAAIPDGTLQQMPQAAIEMWIVRVQAALMAGDPSLAAHLLGQLSRAHEDERVQARCELARAEVALAQGDAPGALALLPAEAHPGLNQELRLRGLALRVAAQARLGQLSADTVAAAQAVLADDAAHALAALFLQRALAVAAQAGVAGAPADAAARHRKRVAALAGSLAAHPAQQTAFLKAWG